jgi:hypothetical protein
MKIKEGFKFSSGPVVMGHGTFIERLPPEYWDHRNDPEWIVKFDGPAGGTKVVPESEMRQYTISQATV